MWPRAGHFQGCRLWDSQNGYRTQYTFGSRIRASDAVHADLLQEGSHQSLMTVMGGTGKKNLQIFFRSSHLLAHALTIQLRFLTTTLGWTVVE